MVASMAAQRRQKGGRGRRYSMGGGGVPFYRRLEKAPRATGGAMAAVKPWARQSGSGHCPNDGSAVGRLCLDRVTDRWVPRSF
jgi:hypothetical protein